MRSPRRSFTPEFRELAVKLANGGQPMTIVAKELNISRQLLRSWVLIANKGDKIVTPVGLPAAQENELFLLKKENAQLRRENRSIKNASIYFLQGKLHDQVAQVDRAYIHSNLSAARNLTAFLSGDSNQVSFPQITLPSLHGTNMQIEMQTDKGTIQACIARHYMILSKSQKRAADYVLSNLFRSATMSIGQLAVAADISIATANRFALVLGFDGYPSFRATVVSSLDAMFTPLDNRHTEKVTGGVSAHVIANSLNECM